MYRRSQHTDTDKVRRELSDMNAKIMSKDSIIQDLNLKCEELLAY
jgi:cell division protein FtsL